MTNTATTHTDKLIATAHTGGGWRIGILAEASQGTRKGTAYRVIRMNPQAQYITLDVKWDEAEARKAANKVYRAETGTQRPEEKMICGEAWA